MTTEEFSKITIQISSYCNTDMFDETAAAYRRMFINRNYEQVREAVELAYMGGYLNENAQRRTIPAPHMFDQFFRNIQKREDVPQMPDVPIELARFNLGMLTIILGLMRIRYKPDKPNGINWRLVKAENGQTWGKVCADFWQEFNCGVMNQKLFLETIANIAPGLEKEIDNILNRAEEPPQDDVPF